ncbi:MAG TPA: hypothetical protein PLB01_06865 [Thermoanaerobaculia bacterium]|nr:hypothetical protein [Thermoanaerobaculia bacterium]
MREVAFRFVYLVWFLAFMATIYLALHMIVAKLIRNPQSKVLAFLTIMTHPLTVPARSFLGPGTPEARVRGVTLGGLVCIWLLARTVMAFLASGLA